MEIIAMEVAFETFNQIDEGHLRKIVTFIIKAFILDIFFIFIIVFLSLTDIISACFFITSSRY